jgi:hypothetical protein
MLSSVVSLPLIAVVNSSSVCARVRACVGEREGGWVGACVRACVCFFLCLKTSEGYKITRNACGHYIYWKCPTYKSLFMSFLFRTQFLIHSDG